MLKKIWPIVFYPLFFLLCLLNLLFFSYELKAVLYIAWTFFLFVSYKNFFLPNLANLNKSHKLIIFAFAVFLLSQLVSLFFSPAWPQGIDYLLYYFLSFSIFLLFLLAPNQLIQERTFFFYLNMFTVVLNILVLLLSMYSWSTSIFPGMNMLVRSYGHNHYAAFLLLVLPLFWGQLFQLLPLFNKSRRFDRLLLIILLASSYFLLIISLGRIVLLLAILQLVFIVLWKKQSLLQMVKQPWFASLLKSLVFVLLLGGLIFLLLSFVADGQQWPCKAAILNKSVCHRFNVDQRLVYWQRAWLVAKDHLWLGAGPDNFINASRQHILASLNVSAFAHNVFLQFFAETGLLGLSAFALLVLSWAGGLLKVMRQESKNVGHSLTPFLLLAVLSSFLNALFDFDWSFFLIFNLTLIFIALLLRRAKDSPLSDLSAANIRSKQWPWLIPIYLVLALLFLYSLLNLVTAVLLAEGKNAWVVRNLPFFRPAIVSLIEKKKLTDQDYWLLKENYGRDPAFVAYYYDQTNLPLAEQYQLFYQLSYIEPAVFVQAKKLDTYLRQDYALAASLAQRVQAIVEEQDLLSSETLLTYDQRIYYADNFFLLAEILYQRQDYQRAAYFYQLLPKYKTYKLSDSAPTFLQESDPEKLLALFKYLTIEPSFFGVNYYNYLLLQQQSILYLFQQSRIEEAIALSRQLFLYEPNAAYFVFRDIIAWTKSRQSLANYQVHLDNFFLYQSAFADNSKWQELDLKVLQARDSISF